MECSKRQLVQELQKCQSQGKEKKESGEQFQINGDQRIVSTKHNQ